MTISVYNGTSFANVTPHICTTAGSWTLPATVKLYDGTAWQIIWSGVSFSVPPGSYGAFGSTAAGYILTSSASVVWTYSISGDTAYLSRNPASGGTSTSANFSLTESAQDAGTSVTISNLIATYNGAQYGPWTINLTTAGTA